LLLNARRTGDIDRQQSLALSSNGAAAQRSAANANSAVFRAMTQQNTDWF